MDQGEEPTGRRMHNVARRYVESLEAERVTLTKRVLALTRAVDEQRRHHAEAHPECRGTAVVGRMNE